MKKIIALTLGLITASALSWGMNYGDSAVYSSSFTLTNESFVVISTFPGTSLYAVIVASPTSGGLIGIYDGAFNPVVSTISLVDMNLRGSYTFNVSVSSGLMYKTSGNANGVTIIWRNKHVTP